MEEKLVKGQWSKERAWQWYNEQPWIRGYNGYPSNCVNRIAMWQEYEHEEVFKQIEYEFNLAKETGFKPCAPLFSSNAGIISTILL